MTLWLCGWMISDLAHLLFLLAGRTGKGIQPWCHLCVGVVTTGGTWEVVITKPTPQRDLALKLIKKLPDGAFCYYTYYTCSKVFLTLYSMPLAL